MDLSNASIMKTLALDESEWSDMVAEQRQKIVDLQREVYELMFRKGWYCLEKVDDSKINEKYQILDTEYTDIVQ